MREKGLLLILLGVVAYVVYDFYTGGQLSNAIAGNEGIPSYPGVPSSLIENFSSAIAVAEGFGIQGAIPTLANNPGDLENGDVGYGILGEGITVYPDIDTGWQALYRQVGIMLSGASSHYQLSENFQQVGGTYAGDSVAWPANVVGVLASRGYNIGIGNTLQDLVNEANG